MVGLLQAGRRPDISTAMKTNTTLSLFAIALLIAIGIVASVEGFYMLSGAEVGTASLEVVIPSAIAAAAAPTAGQTGGAPATGGISELSTTIILPAIIPGSPAIIEVDAATLVIEQVVLDVLQKVTDITFTITKLAGKPADVESASGTAYSYFNFDTNLNNANLNLATIRFQVTKKWLADNSIDKNTVSLQRWETSKWTNLGARLISDSSDVIYESETTGFNIFVITGEKSAAAPAQEKGQPAQLGAQKQASFRTPAVIAIMVLTILTISLIAFITREFETSEVHRFSEYIGAARKLGYKPKHIKAYLLMAGIDGKIVRNALLHHKLFDIFHFKKKR